MLWVSWPKKISKIETDLNGNVFRDHGLDHGQVDIKVSTVDKIWPVLKFLYHTKDR